MLTGAARPGSRLATAGRALATALGLVTALALTVPTPAAAGPPATTRDQPHIGTPVRALEPGDPPQVTVSTQVGFYLRGDTIPVRIRLTAAGRPVAGQPVFLRHRCVAGPGDGELLGPFTTGADGSVTQTIASGTLGWHDVDAEYFGGAGLGPAFSGSVEVTVVPPGPPARPDGALVSSDGTYTRTTTVYGEGFQPQSSVTVSAYPAPVLLATTTAGDDGRIAVDIALPEPLSGQQTIVAQGSADSPQGTVLRNLAVKVTIPSNGPAAIVHRKHGRAILASLTVGTLLILIGLGLGFWSWRRRDRIDLPSRPARDRQLV